MNSDPGLIARNQQKLLNNSHLQIDTGCRMWDGQISNAGYGKVMLKTDEGNKMFTVSRAAYLLFVGPVHKDQIVTQKCGCRLCLNPDHLELIDPISRSDGRQTL